MKLKKSKKTKDEAQTDENMKEENAQLNDNNSQGSRKKRTIEESSANCDNVNDENKRMKTEDVNMENSDKEK